MNNLALLIMTAFIGGIFVASKYSVPQPLAYVAAFTAILALVWTIWKKTDRPVLWIAAICFFACGIIRYEHFSIVSHNDVSLFSGQKATLKANVVELPKVEPVDTMYVKVKYILQVKELREMFATKSSDVSGLLFVSVKQAKGASIARYGDELIVSGEIALPHGFNNPGLYNGADALRIAGIRAYLTNSKVIKINTHHHHWNWQAALFEWRIASIERMRQVMPEDSAAILAGMLFGGYSGIKKEVINDFAATGIIHILSVSGTHIALVAGVIIWLAGRLSLSRRVSFVVVAIAIFAYSFISGLTPPVVRSALMGLAALLAIQLGRQNDAPTALSLTALAMVAYQPSVIFDISFQLSLAATAGLVFFYPPSVKVLKAWPAWLAGPLAVTWSAQIAVLPFVAWYFNSFSISAFVANIVIVPIIELIVVVGLFGITIFSFIPVLGNILLGYCGMLILTAVKTASLFAAVPGGKLYMPAIGGTASIVYYLLMFWLHGYKIAGIPAYKECLKLWPTRTILIAGVFVLSIICYYIYPRPMSVHFIDVGQGDSTLVITPHGRAVLVDTGGVTKDSPDGFDIGERVVVPYLKHYGVTSLDYLLLTHGHQDHAGGAAGIASAFPVNNVLLPLGEFAPAVRDLVNVMRRENVIPLQAGQIIMLDGVSIQVVYAGEIDNNRRGNECSSVFRIGYGDHCFLLTGDLEGKVEAKLVSENKLAASTVLKVAHHGSKGSTTDEFLQAVRPQYAVISVGYRNRFGHPHKETIERLNRKGIKVWRTDQNGAVVFTSDGVVLRGRSFL